MAEIIGRTLRSPTQLAPEVHAMILENLRNSKRDLSVCSVVCKCWLPLCRRHLFSEVNYRPDLAKLLTSSAHAISTVSPHIRKVTIKGSVLMTAEKDMAIDFISNLPHLRSLIFEKSDWNNLQSPISLSFGRTPAFWSQLTTLHLRSVHISTFIELVSLIESFSFLQDLSLDSVSWDGLGCVYYPEDSSHDSTMSSSTLGKIHIAFCHNIVLLNWLQYGVISDSILESKTTGRETCRFFPNLALLSLPDIQPAEAQTLGLFLTTVGDSLERFEVGVLSDILGSSKVLDLSSNNNLKTVVIHQVTLFRFPLLVEQEDSAMQFSNSTALTSPYGWLPNMLSTISSTKFISIELRIWVSDQSQLDDFPWNLLCEVLVKVGVSLIRLTISGIGRDVDSVRQWFRGRLARFDKDDTFIDFHFTG